MASNTRSSRTSDQPGFRRSIGELGKKAAERRKDPYCLDLGGDHGPVYFPDPASMAPLEAEEMLAEILSPATSVSHSLRRWIVAENDRKAWDAAMLDGTVEDFAVLQEISDDVVRYYENIFGRPGEETASRS